MIATTPGVIESSLIHILISISEKAVCMYFATISSNINFIAIQFLFALLNILFVTSASICDKSLMLGVGAHSHKEAIKKKMFNA